jgi:hypothetical protein
MEMSLFLHPGGSGSSRKICHVIGHYRAIQRIAATFAALSDLNAQSSGFVRNPG